MIKNLHFLLILDPKHDISKRRIKRRILTWFLRFFWPEITSKKFKRHISTKHDKGYRLVYELSYLVEKKILLNFHYKGDPYQKKSKFFEVN